MENIITFSKTKKLTAEVIFTSIKTLEIASYRRKVFSDAVAINNYF